MASSRLVVDMDLARFCSPRVLIVAGKGGVGKTTVTATLATAAAGAGLSVLIVEVEGKSGLAACFGKPPLGYEETELAPGVRGRTLTPDEALLDYLESHGLRRISKRLVRSGALEVVASAVPGMKDILVLGKVKALELERTADLILIDAPAAGHAISFLMSPRGLGDAVRVGPVSKQSTEVIEMLSDPARCQVVLVTIPEETPVNELVDTAFALEDRIGIQLAPVVVNGCYPDIGSPASADDVEHLADDLGVFVPPREATDLAAAAEFRHDRHSLQQEQADRLAERLPLPQIRLPFVFTAEIGPSEIEVLAAAFASEVEALPAAASGHAAV
jgi:anion-transporting  ArsA/GET3 family ATPase